MRRVKACLFIAIYCLLPLIAHAENKKIIIPCAELTALEVEQLPPGYPVPEAACGDKCFHIVFVMEDATAFRVNSEFNAYKDSTREVYIGDLLLTTVEPFHIDAPYSQKASSAAYATLEEALNEARRFCPNAAVKAPKTVRR